MIFQSSDRSQLEAQGVRQTFASILQICIDPRPKVHKKAADLVKEVLANPPTPLVRHPYAESEGKMNPFNEVYDVSLHRFIARESSTLSMDPIDFFISQGISDDAIVGVSPHFDFSQYVLMLQ